MFNTKDTTDYKELYLTEKEKFESLDSDFTSAVREHEIEVTDLKRDHKFQIKDLEKSHELALKDMQFKLDHMESTEIKKLTAEKIELEKNLAVATETIKQLDRIIDLDADIIDVKEVVNKLIDKLPSLNISTLSLSAPASSREESKK